MYIKCYNPSNWIVAAVAASWMLSLAVSPSSAQPSEDSCPENPIKSGTFVFDGESQAFFVGYRWGQGVLTLTNGQEFEFLARGLKFGEFGAREARITGDVYGLESLEDFIGHYQGTAGGALTIIGRSDIQLVNSQCVTLVASSKEKGWNFSLEADQGLIIQFSED
ncbi:hypothetical protein [Ruegeria faecimaris]|uniref:hypothetical protein n=1 Tax=Ruegeria faecimaris TaxID=686389 RepID=UPI00232E8C61|nr:hypothetical protein [Ruegeria faecimaris]